MSHEWIDQRSLALHTEVAQMIRGKPELLTRAKANLQRWIQNQKPPVSAALREWDVILKNSTLEEVLSLITRDDEDARRLRQSSPFCGILTQERRLAIFQEYEAILASARTSKPSVKNSPTPLITDDQYRSSLIAAFGSEWAAISQLPESERIAAMARIDELQGESPDDRACQLKVEMSRSQPRAGIRPARIVQTLSGKFMRNC